MRLLLVLALLLACVLADPDYYKILGISKNADDKEVKKAYRAMSKKYHPDKNNGDEDTNHKFIEVGEAYEVLSDPKKRKLYDQYGVEGVKNGGGGGGGGGGQYDPFDMFSHFFGGGGHGGGGGQGKRRGNDASVSIDFTLKQFYNGETTDFTVRMQSVCSKCDGTGSQDKKTQTCHVCHGSGRVRIKRQLAPGMIQQQDIPCQQCGGKGSVVKHKCTTCQGNAVVREERTYPLHLQQGAPRNSVEIIQGEADKSPDWVAGDLHVVMGEKPDGNLGYRRVGINLYRTEVLSFKEATHGGWTRKIPFLDNYDPSITLSREAGKMVQSGEVETIKGKGMPKHNNEDEHGDLFIEYVVVFPGGGKTVKDEL
ncbi:unnamed protein product [Kuraishia capsulata CBS 1993]|uniref:DnaJ-related protein SCJ1 n=1 Tax=Kuraishia capsulata CBS 1993 TaxID=1382522 RepID=W6MT72_9ASCO|nr:uncharacterized protein KUCA_T00004389001 [Kuraishia capsulata CBS 1993]CDK28407.1 unnamed protein product [Kuraishia capsulata CBS 1993]